MFPLLVTLVSLFLGTISFSQDCRDQLEVSADLVLLFTPHLLHQALEEIDYSVAPFITGVLQAGGLDEAVLLEPISESIADIHVFSEELRKYALLRAFVFFFLYGI